jgi:hypothetical protein
MSDFARGAKTDTDGVIRDGIGSFRADRAPAVRRPDGVRGAALPSR